MYHFNIVTILAIKQFKHVRIFHLFEDKKIIKFYLSCGPLYQVREVGHAVSTGLSYDKMNTNLWYQFHMKIKLAKDLFNKFHMYIESV